MLFTTGPDEKRGTRPATLIGRRVCLRALRRGDLVHLRKWLEDAEIRGLIGEVAAMSKADSEKFLEKVRADTQRAWFMVVVKENDRVIGEAGLLRMDRAWRTTDVSVIIWEREEWGKGYGTEAVLLLLDHAFRHLDFHRAAVGVVGFNERALRFWEKVGFRKEGVQRDGYYYDGQYHDFVLMSILENEFKELHREIAVRRQTKLVRQEKGRQIVKENMVAFCGITCSDCRAFIAAQKNDRELKKKVARSWSTEKEPLKPEDIDCEGCLPTGGRLFKFCKVCQVRRCGCEKGVENCAHCREFPCEKLTGLWKSFRLRKPRATLEGIRNKLQA